MSINRFAQSDSIVIKNIQWNETYPAGSTELFIPFANALLAGFIYRPNGAKKLRTLLLLHGFPGNERKFDVAQVAMAHRWNVIYFNYRGYWGSQGTLSFKNCVEDVKIVVSYCNK